MRTHAEEKIEEKHFKADLGQTFSSFIFSSSSSIGVMTFLSSFACVHYYYYYYSYYYSGASSSVLLV